MSSCHFSNLSKVALQTSLQLTSEQSMFFSDFFGRVLEVVTYADARLFESYHELFKGALGIIEKEENERNGQYLLALKKIEEGEGTPRRKALRRLWEERMLADREAGRRTEVPLKSDNGNNFTSFRKLRTLLEIEPPHQRIKALNLITNLGLEPVELTGEELSDLQQVTSVGLRRALAEEMHRVFLLNNRFPTTPKEFQDPQKLASEVVNALAQVVFETIDKMPVELRKDQIEFKLSVQLAWIHLSIEAILLRYFYDPRKKQSKSPRLAQLADILKTVNLWQQGFASVTPRKKEGGLVAFLGFEKKEVKPPSPFQKPSFSSLHPNWRAFLKDWQTLNSAIVGLKDLLLEHKRKGTTLLSPPQSARAKLQREVSFAPYLIKAEASPRKEMVTQLMSVLEQTSHLMILVEKELEPVLLPIVSLAPASKLKHSGGTQALFDPSHAQLDRFLTLLQELIHHFEAIVLRYIAISDEQTPTEMVALYLESLRQKELEENLRIEAEVAASIKQLERKGECDPHRWAAHVFEVDLALSKKIDPSIGKQTLRLLGEDLKPLPERYFRRMLNQNYRGVFLEITPEDFIKKVNALSMRDALKMNMGYGSIVSQSVSPEADFINGMMLFLSEEKMRILKGCNGLKADVKQLPKLLENSSENDFKILMINALADAYMFLQSLKGSNIWLKPFSQTTEEPSTISKRLKVLQKELGVGGSRIGRGGIPRHSTPVEGEMMDERQKIDGEIKSLIEAGYKVSAMIKTHYKRGKNLQSKTEVERQKLLHTATEHPTLPSDMVILLNQRETETKDLLALVQKEKGMAKTLFLCMQLVQDVASKLFEISPPGYTPSRSSGVFMNVLRSSGLVKTQLAP